MSTESLIDATESDTLCEIDLDNMVSEVKQQTYNQERLKFNFQIILKELREQRGTIQGLRYLEQENRTLKQNLAETAQSLRRLIENNKTQTDGVKTQADQLALEQIEVKDRLQNHERITNQQQIQLQMMNEKQKSNERTHDAIQQEINSLILNQNEIKIETQKEIQRSNESQKITNGKVDRNSEAINALKGNISEQNITMADLKNNINEIKNDQQLFQTSIQLQMKSNEKKIQILEDNAGKLGDKIEGTNRRVDGHSSQIKELYERIKKITEEIKGQERLIQENDRKIHSLETVFNLKNNENDKEFSGINIEIDKLKNQITQLLQSLKNMKPVQSEPQRLYDDDLALLREEIEKLKNLTQTLTQQLSQLKAQFSKLGQFATKDSVKELKDYYIQCNQILNKEIEELKRQLSRLPKQQPKGLTEEQVKIYIVEMIQKAADKEQTKKALLYLENLIQGYHQQQPETAQGPLPPFTCQGLLWSAPKCAACLSSGEPGKCTAGCSNLTEKNNKVNKMICCQQAFKVQVEKNFPKLINSSVTPKYSFRPATSKNNSNLPKSLVNIPNSQNFTPLKNRSVIFNVDLNITSENNHSGMKKCGKYSEKQFIKTQEEIARTRNIVKSDF